jgi:DNA-binding transcriptional ArsR family regulator
MHLSIEYSRYVDLPSAILVLDALAQSTRINAFKLLATGGPNGLTAGEVARRLSTPQNTMSVHLSTLARAGLVRAERHSRNVIYRADPDRLTALISFLKEDCLGRKSPRESDDS